MASRRTQALGPQRGLLWCFRHVSASSTIPHVPERFDEVLRLRLARNLALHPRRVRRVSDGASELRPAAVALTLVPGEAGEPTFLLTRRPSDLPHHPGQFALPGGRLVPGESSPEAARRELAEELSVALGPERVLGLLDDFTTHSGFVVTPVVLWGPDIREIVPDPREVAVSYRVPLSDLYGREVPILRAVPGLEAPLLMLPLVGTHIFSPTAAIIFQFREWALEGRHTAVQGFAQPRFAWR